MGIIGRTGSGKTSVVQCLTRLIEYESGSVKYFGRSFQSIEQARMNFSVIAQDPFVFEGSILENIDPSGQLSEEEVRRVISEYAKEDSLPLKLNARVDELGSNLSLGQRQVLVVLRTLLQQRRMVILDECTGSLDEEYNDLIRSILDSYLKVIK